MQPFKYEEETIGIPRDDFIAAVNAELPLADITKNKGWFLSAGFAEVLYNQSLYQKKIAFGKNGCPFTCQYYKGKVDYKKGLCPVAERLHEKVLFVHNLYRPPLAKKDLDNVVNAFYKVYENRNSLQKSKIQKRRLQ